jgi:hypothetical protein
MDSTPSVAVMILVVVWGLLGWNDHYCFSLQRTALLVCRSAGLGEEWRFAMLPKWYRTASPSVAGKWVAVLAIGVLESWGAAILMAVAQPIYSALAPINHGANLLRLRKAIGTSGLDPDISAVLTDALDSFGSRRSQR